MTSEILKLIETVSPDDTQALDEIDARVFGYVEMCSSNVEWEDIEGRLYAIARDWQYPKWRKISRYTRSRDALKAIRPEGWKFTLEHRIGDGKIKFDEWKYQVIGHHYTGEYGAFGSVYTNTDKNYLPTEELAELHAIIQAIEHTRSQA
jgi:hypothetical protein